MKNQPRIKGTKREPKHSSLLPQIRHGLEKLARQEGKSMSWVIAELICDYFDIDAATGKLKNTRKRA